MGDRFRSRVSMTSSSENVPQRYTKQIGKHMNKKFNFKNSPVKK